ncbi:MAG: mechanosensitive ion channel domain-containing protein [Caldilinea sp.]
MNGANSITDILALNQDNLIAIALILVGAWLLIAANQRIFPWLASRVPNQHRNFFLAGEPVLRLLIIMVSVVLIVTRIIDPTFENLVVLLSATGLALGFAFKDYISSLLAGVVTLYELPYRPGDWIAVNGAYGKVRSIGTRAAEIVTLDDTVVVIPHLKLWDQLIYNGNDGSRNLMCIADFYLHPDHDAARVKQALYDVALTSAFLQIAQPIFVIVQEKPWGTHYRLKAYPIEPDQQLHFVTDMTVRGKARLASLDVRFAQLPVFPGQME